MIRIKQFKNSCFLNLRDGSLHLWSFSAGGLLVWIWGIFDFWEIKIQDRSWMWCSNIENTSVYMYTNLLESFALEQIILFCLFVLFYFCAAKFFNNQKNQWHIIRCHILKVKLHTNQGLIVWWMKGRKISKDTIFKHFWGLWSCL